MRRESFVFYRSFAEAIKNLDKETKADFLDALCAYALDGEEIDDKGVVSALMSLVKPQIDANNRRYENGLRGGRPKNQNKPKQNQNETKAKPNVNDNDNDNVNDNDKKKNKKEKEPKHRRGEFGNVMLTDIEYEKIQERFPLDYDDKIDNLSNYLASTGKVYKSHYYTILSWARREAMKPKERAAPKNRSTRTPEQLEEVLSDDIYEVF